MELHKLKVISIKYEWHSYSLNLRRFYMHIMIQIYSLLSRFLVLREWRVFAPTALATVSNRQPISFGSVGKRSDVASTVRVQISVGQRAGPSQSAPSNKLLVRQSHASTTGKL